MVYYVQKMNGWQVYICTGKKTATVIKIVLVEYWQIISN